MRRGLAAGVVGLALASAGAARPPLDPLRAGFDAPPSAARPLVFWQWVNGNVSEEGIRLDLEWMQRIGIAGALVFDIGFRTPPVPQYVERRVGFGTREWREAMRFAAAEARRLGLELGAQTSGGWSVSGGPTVSAAQAMKKLVWSETLLTPATPPTLRLPAPPTESGPYQDISIDAPYREPALGGDVAVIAYRLPDIEQAAIARPELSGAANTALLDDARYSETTPLIPDAGGSAVLLARFAPGAVPRALTLAVREPMPAGVIEAGADGVLFTTVIELPATQSAPVRTVALPERGDPLWRIRFTGLAKPLQIAEARFEFGGHVHLAQDKAGFGVLGDYAAAGTAPVPPGASVQPGDVIDVTRHLASDGTLRWRPRAGRWAALRFGWSLTGRRTVPATAESIGLEVDKLDAHAVRAFADAWLGGYPRGNSGRLGIALTDSWEAGQQNWTPAMPREFAARRGYDLHPWLPVLTGRIVGDADRSERFLSDYRRTIADLLAGNHYGVLAAAAHARGMTLYAEAAGTDLPTVIDGIQAKGRVDVPMGEYWYYPEGEPPKASHVADVREAASAAHLYGRKVVAAEALTTRGEQAWALGPAQLRRIADRFFAEGVNRVVLHTSAHQPFTDRRPGITLRQYGQHFTRNETWAEDAGGWVRYLGRTSHLLQQGRPVADVAIFIGEDAALSPPFDEPAGPPRLPGFDHDFVNAEALLTRLRVRDGRLTRADGMSYRALVIDRRVRRMSLPVIAKLRAYVAAGGILIGAQPDGAIGLAGDAQVRAMAQELWGGQPRAAAGAARGFGRGRVYAPPDAGAALRAEGVLPDVAGTGIEDLHWAHRSQARAEIYFLTNQSARPFTGTVRFRVRGRHAEQWDAVDGSRAPVTHAVEDQTTAVRIELEPYASKFIVFSGSAAIGEYVAPSSVRAVVSTLDGPWDVEFLDGQGAPAQAQLATLASWTGHADAAIRHYSGRVRYTRSVAIPEAWRAERRRIELDLGAVAELARVRINGQDFPVLWNVPFRLDVTDALRSGDNRFEITVTNYWINRLIGDEQPGATRIAFASIRPYTADSLLRRSGLFGPVCLLGVR